MGVEELAARCRWHLYSLFYLCMFTPEGIDYNFYTNKFGTPKMSALYTLVNIKKDQSKADESLLMNVVESNWNNILMEFTRLASLMRGLSLA